LVGVAYLPVGLYENSQPLGAEPENVDDTRVAGHGNGRQKKHDDELIPSERNACYVAVEVVVHARRHDNVTVSVVVQ